MSASHPSIAIIIVNWNGFELTKRCIESIEKISYPNYGVFLIDNASDNDEADKLSTLFPAIHTIKLPTNTGFTGGNNRGISEALNLGFDMVMLLNNDTVVDAGFIEPLVEQMELDGVGAVQPLIFNPDKRTIWNAGGQFNGFLGVPKALGKRMSSRAIGILSRKVDWITGCCILVKSSVVRDIGMLDDKFFAYFEDVDWSLRIRKGKYSLWLVPKSRIYHEAGGSTKSEIKTEEGIVNPLVHYLNVRNHIFLIRKHVHGLNTLSAWLYQLSKLSVYVFYFLFRRRFAKMKATYNGFVDGIMDAGTG